MPKNTTAILEKKRTVFRSRGKSTASVDEINASSHIKKFLTIGPALPNVPVNNNVIEHKEKPRVHSTHVSKVNNNSNNTGNNPYDFLEDGKLLPGHPVLLQTTADGKIHASRAQKEKERYPDRISLDRRGLSVLPIIDGEPRLRLLSMQHNLLTKLDGLHSQNFVHLVFLDIYDNQLDRISSMDSLISLRVLLMGKNRIRRIEGLKSLIKLEVLDLHGNRLLTLSGLSTLTELKVLNVAGNQIKTVGTLDLKGLKLLREANLRRNKLRKLLGFSETPQLEKLFLSNNDLQSVEDMSSLAKAINLKEITIDNNPVSLGGDCVSFLVSYLPNLNQLSGMQITDQVRKAAMVWRHNKELSNSTFMDLTTDVCSNIRREEVISNARTNWELLRSQTKCLTSCTTNTYFKDLKTDCDLVIAPTDFTLEKGKRRRSCSLRRSQSVETENSQHTSSSSTNSDNLKLPPILVPMMNNLEKLESRITSSNKCLSIKQSTWDLTSSIDPNINSPVSSLHSSNSSESSDSEEEVVEQNSDKPKAPTPSESPSLLPNVISKLAISSEPEMKITPTPIISTDNSSTISTGSTTSTYSRTTASSCGESSSSKAGTVRSHSSQRTIKSAMPIKKFPHHHRINIRAATAKPKARKNCQSSPAGALPTKDREQGSDYLAEICGRSLNIYGHGALRYIDKSWSSEKANDVVTVKFTYVNFNGITCVLTKLKNRFPNAESFIFRETNIYCLGQINALAEVQGLYSLEIESEGNPVTEKNWRSYAIFRLTHWGLKVINNTEVTEDEVTKANEEYQSLSDLVAWSLPDALLQPLLQRLQVENPPTNNLSAKQWLFSADPALKSVVSKEALQWHRGAISQEDLIWRQKARNQFGILIDNTCDAIDKLNLLEKEWNSILKDIVQSTLLDYSQMNTYMKDRMKQLK